MASIERNPLITHDPEEPIVSDEISKRKTISTFGGISLLVNSMTGPALINVPVVISHAGWVPVLVIVLIMWGTSSFSSLVLCEAMSLYPGNEGFKGKVELTTLCKHLFGRKVFFVILAVLNVCLLSLNIASIIATAQSLDFLTLEFAHNACGLQVYPKLQFYCVQEAPIGEITPFGDVYVVSVGILVVLCVVVPLGYINLNSNIIVQQAAFMSVILIAILWTADFIRIGFHGNLSAWGGISNQNEVLGTVMFNFVVGVAVPSWVNEKKPEVSAKRVLFSSTTAASLIFFYIGLLGAKAFKYPGDGNLLSILQTCDQCFLATRITAYFLPCCVFLTSIPVYSIIVRYNLASNKVVPKGVDFFIAVIVPWLIAVPFYTGSGLINVINWASLYLQSSVNFILPLVIYVYIRRRNETNNEESALQLGGGSFTALSSFQVGRALAIILIAFITVAVLVVTVMNIV